MYKIELTEYMGWDGYYGDQDKIIQSYYTEENPEINTIVKLGETRLNKKFLEVKHYNYGDHYSFSNGFFITVIACGKIYKTADDIIKGA